MTWAGTRVLCPTCSPRVPNAGWDPIRKKKGPAEFFTCVTGTGTRPRPPVRSRSGQGQILPASPPESRDWSLGVSRSNVCTGRAVGLPLAVHALAHGHGQDQGPGAAEPP